MTPNRREFIQELGIALASLMLVRCSSPGVQGSTPRERLRNCWLRFDWLAEATQDWDNYERGEEALDELISAHRSSLDELISAGELDQEVADQVQKAFDEASYHVWRSNAPITCYEPMLIDYTPSSSSRLVAQASTLAEFGASDEIDPDTVAQAEAAIERDMAFLNLSPGEVDALYNRLIKATGESYDFPAFDDLELEISPDAAEAARFLIALLLAE